jgi:hypothetical protein
LLPYPRPKHNSPLISFLAVLPNILELTNQNKPTPNRRNVDGSGTGATGFSVKFKSSKINELLTLPEIARDLTSLKFNEIS